MPTTLTDLKTKEVSVVDRGANKKRFAMRKSDMDTDVLKACLDVPLEGEADVDTRLEKAGIHDKARHAIKGSLRIIQGFADHITEADRNTTVKLLASMMGVDLDSLKAVPPPPPGKPGKPPANADDDEDEEDDEDEDDPPKPERRPAVPPQGSRPTAKAEEPPMSDPKQEAPAPASAPAAPAVSSDVAKMATELQKMREQNEAVQKQLQLEVERRETAEAIDLAKREFSDLGDAKVVGPLVMRLTKSAGDADAEALRTILKTAQARLQKSQLFSIRGHGHPGATAGGGDPVADLNAKVSELVKAGMSEEAAVTKAMNDDPDLATRLSPHKNKRGA